MCEERNVPKPIFVGETEFNQVALSEFNSKYGDSFFDKVIFNKENKGASKLGNVIEYDDLNPHTNPTLLVPDDNNATIQLTDVGTEFNQEELIS